MGDPCAITMDGECPSIIAPAAWRVAWKADRKLRYVELARRAAAQRRQVEALRLHVVREAFRAAP